MKEKTCTCNDQEIRVSFQLDSLSKKIAENLTGRAIREKIRSESKIFADHKFSKNFIKR